jgi:putative ABC transport system permease protein
VALQELWGLMSVAERALTIVAVFVAVAAFLGMIAVSLASLNERRREIAILRAVGAGLPYIAGLMLVETLILTSAGIAIGLVSLYTGLALLQPVIESAVGLYLPIDWPTTNELGYLAVLLVVGILCGVVPALKAYRQALVDGLTVDR